MHEEKQTSDGKSTTEIAKVPFHDGHILVIGEQVLIRPLCALLGVDFTAQSRRIHRESRWKTCVAKMATQVPGDDQRREHLTLHRRRLAAFVYGIQAGMVKDPKIRANLEAYQEEIDDVIDAYFNARAAGAQKEGLLEALQEQVQRLTSDLERTRTDLRLQADSSGRAWTEVGALRQQMQQLNAGPVTVAQLDWLKESMKDVAGLRLRVMTHLSLDKAYARVQRDVRERLGFTLEWEQLPYARFDEAYTFLRRLHKIAIREAREVGYGGADTWTQPPLPFMGGEPVDEEDEAA